MSAIAGINEARRVWDQPGKRVPDIAARGPLFDRYWGYLSNTGFDTLDSVWQAYKVQNGLSRNHRMIINPWFRLAKFYVGGIYGAGGLSFDGKPLPAGYIDAIPMGDDTPEAIRIMAGQLYEWSNWLVGKNLQVQNATALGCALVEVVEDRRRGMVYFEQHYPGRAKDLDQDPQGNVKGAVLEWEVTEMVPRTRPVPGGAGQKAPEYRVYTYRKEMTGGDDGYIATYRAERGSTKFVLWDPSGEGPGIQDNPWGFVPLVWVQHENVGTGFGLPAGWAVQSKIDNINDLATLLLDHVGKIVDMPILVKSGKQIPTTVNVRNTTTTPEDVMNGDPNRGREEVPFIDVGIGGGSEVVPLDIGEALEYLDRLIEELEKDLPELGMWQQTREKGGDVTGEGMDRLHGDVNGRLFPAMQVHDQATKKLLQMGMTMAGVAVNNGWWGAKGFLTEEQKKFGTITLDTFRKNKKAMDFTIKPRPLITPSELKRWELEQVKATVLGNLKDTGLFPGAWLLEKYGIAEADIQQILDDADEESQAALEKQQMAFDRGQVPGVPGGKPQKAPGAPGQGGGGAGGPSNGGKPAGA